MALLFNGTSDFISLSDRVTWVDLTDTVASNTWTSLGFKRASGTAFGYVNGVISPSGATNTPNTPTSGKASI